MLQKKTLITAENLNKAYVSETKSGTQSLNSNLVVGGGELTLKNSVIDDTYNTNYLHISPQGNTMILYDGVNDQEFRVYGSSGSDSTYIQTFAGANYGLLDVQGVDHLEINTNSGKDTVFGGNVEIRNTNNSYLFLNADTDNNAGEVGSAGIYFTQDATDPQATQGTQFYLGTDNEDDNGLHLKNLSGASFNLYVSDFSVVNFNDTVHFNEEIGVYKGIQMYPEAPGAPIGDIFAGTNTNKSYINFAGANGSNDPGYIMHETSGVTAHNNQGVLHLVPSDDNSEDDYIAIHGTNDPETIKIYTTGRVVTPAEVQAGSLDVNGNADIAGTLHLNPPTSDAWALHLDMKYNNPPSRGMLIQMDADDTSDIAIEVQGDTDPTDGTPTTWQLTSPGHMYMWGNIYMQGRDVNGVGALYADSINSVRYIHGEHGEMMQSTDGWLRINDNDEHTNGIYLGNSVVRTDGEFQVGAGGADFNVKSGGYVDTNNGATFRGKITIDEPIGLRINGSSAGGAAVIELYNPDNADNITNITNRDGSYFVLERGNGSDLLNVDQNGKLTHHGDARIDSRLTIGYQGNGSLALEGGGEPAKMVINNPDNSMPWTAITARDGEALTIERWASSTENNSRELMHITESGVMRVYGEVHTDVIKSYGDMSIDGYLYINDIRGDATVRGYPIHNIGETITYSGGGPSGGENGYIHIEI